MQACRATTGISKLWGPGSVLRARAFRDLGVGLLCVCSATSSAAPPEPGATAVGHAAGFAPVIGFAATPGATPTTAGHKFAETAEGSPARSAVGSAQAPTEVESVVVRHFELRWRAPELCADGGSMALEVERLVGKPLDELKASTLVVEGTVFVKDRSYRAELTFDDGSGERKREIEGATCEEVCSAAALTIAIALDPTLMTRAPPAVLGHCSSAPLVVGALTPLPAPAPCPKVRFAPLRPRPRAMPRVAVGFGAMASVGVLPRTAPGTLALAAAEFEAWRTELFGAIAASATNASPSGSGRGASFQLWALGFRACWLPGAIGLGPCAGGEIGRIMGRGYGVSEPAKDDLTWLATSLGVLERLELGESAELGLRADAMLPLHRPVFQLADEEVYRPSPIAWTLAAHAAARF